MTQSSTYNQFERTEQRFIVGGLIMEEIQKAIELAMKKFKEEYGEDEKLEDGDEFVTVFNNCILIISLEDGRLQTKFIGGKPYEVDYTLSIYESEGK